MSHADVVKLRCRCGRIVLLRPHLDAWKGWHGYCAGCRLLISNQKIGDFERVT